jgi:hypothetical protein
MLEANRGRLKWGLALGVLLHNLPPTTIMHHPSTRMEMAFTVFGKVGNPSFEKAV